MPTKIKKNKIHHQKATEKKHSNKGPIIFSIVLVVVLVALFLIFVPTKSFYYTVQVPYESTEYYTEKEPYEAQESYEVQVPYTTTETYYDTVPVEVSVAYTDYEDKVYTAPSGQYYPSVTSPCRCTNYNFWGQCIQETCQYPVTKYRTEIQQQTIEKTRPVTQYSTETRYRTVTRYQDVQKSRTIMKIRDEQRQKQINWVFSYPVPYTLHLVRE